MEAPFPAQRPFAGSAGQYAGDQLLDDMIGGPVDGHERPASETQLAAERRPCVRGKMEDSSGLVEKDGSSAQKLEGVRKAPRPRPFEERSQLAST